MSVSIQRMRNVFVTGDELGPTGPMLESSIRHAGIDHLSGALDEALDPTDPSVWIIRRLRLAFDILEPRQGQQTWGGGVGEGIGKRIERGEDGNQVIRFPDRASYWASFLRDVAEGDSWRWWYESLSGLRQLEPGTVCVTLLARQPDLSAAVLHRLDDWGVLERSLDLSDSQATQLLAWISPLSEVPEQSRVERAFHAWISAGAPRLDSPRAVLSLTLALLRDAAPSQVRGAVETLAG